MHDNDCSGKMATWKDPIILVAEGGDCTFMKKAHNAQKAGAAGLIITGNTCICNAGGSFAPNVSNGE
jgi:hypothetical protein